MPLFLLRGHLVLQISDAVLFFFVYEVSAVAETGSCCEGASKLTVVSEPQDRPDLGVLVKLRCLLQRSILWRSKPACVELQGEVTRPAHKVFDRSFPESVHHVVKWYGLS